MSAEKWRETVISLLQDLRKPELYIAILIEEKMNEKLIEYCHSNVYRIETLHPYLLDDYPHEVDELFTSYIYQVVGSASDRRRYQEACGKIRTFQKAMGTDAAAALIEELKFMYPKRKALIAELSKV